MKYKLKATKDTKISKNTKLLMDSVKGWLKLRLILQCGSTTETVISYGSKIIRNTVFT